MKCTLASSKQLSEWGRKGGKAKVPKGFALNKAAAVLAGKKRAEQAALERKLNNLEDKGLLDRMGRNETVD